MSFLRCDIEKLMNLLNIKIKREIIEYYVVLFFELLIK